MVRKNSVSFDTKDIITYQSVAKILISILRQDFYKLSQTHANPNAWTIDQFVSTAVTKILAEDLLRPNTDYVFESEVKTISTRVATDLFHEVTSGLKKPDAAVLPDAELLKQIELYLKAIQEEKKATRELNLKSKVRTLSKEELEKYKPVSLSDDDAKAFIKASEYHGKKKP